MPFKKDPRTRVDYELVIQKVIKLELLPDDQGMLFLPPELVPISRHGKVYVTKKEDGLVLIAFRTWVGKGHNMRGYLYSSRSLTARETERDYYGNETVRVGPTELVLTKKWDENWYSVYRNLD